MDPLAHTLFGAALAESGLKYRTRYATATLVIGANLPDIDVIAGLWGSDFELYARRGHTHGILAMLLLPLLLTGAVMLWHRWRSGSEVAARGANRTSSTRSTSSTGNAGNTGRTTRPCATVAADIPPGMLPDAPPFDPRAALFLSCLAIFSHPLLDWMNTYGVRLLMPFDGRWFYGDTLFIVEPWFWVLTAVGVVLARGQSRKAIAGWLVLAAVASGLVLSTNLVPVGVKVTWCLAVATLITLRANRPRWATSTATARAGLLILFLYMGAAFSLARVAESALAERYPQALRVLADPPPALPLNHRRVVEEPDRYRIVTARGPVHEIPRTEPDAIVRQALASPSIRGFVNWVRFPSWTVEDAGEHWRVRIIDLRYQGPGSPRAAGIGVAEVQVPKNRDDSVTSEQVSGWP